MHPDLVREGRAVTDRDTSKFERRQQVEEGEFFGRAGIHKNRHRPRVAGKLREQSPDAVDGVEIASALGDDNQLLRVSAFNENGEGDFVRSAGRAILEADDDAYALPLGLP